MQRLPAQTWRFRSDECADAKRFMSFSPKRQGHWHLYTRIALTVAVLVSVLVTTVQAQPAAVRWSDPIPLSEETSGEIGVALAPDLAVDPVGGVHVVWYGVTSRNEGERRAYSDQIMYRARLDGTWAAAEPVFTQSRPQRGDAFSTATGGAGERNPAFELRARLVAGTDNQVHLLVGNSTTQWFLNAPRTDVIRTAAILPPTALGEASQSQIADRADGTLHAVLTMVPPGIEEVEGATCVVCNDVFYRRSLDGGVTWSRPENLSRSDDHDRSAQLVIDDADRLHALWLQQAGTGTNDPAVLVYRRGDAQGEVWSAPIVLGVAGEDVAQGTLTVGPYNLVLAVYAGATTGSIFFQYSRDGGDTWTAPALIPSVTSQGAADDSYRRFALVSDGDSYVHLVMIGLPLGADTVSAQLLHLIWDGQNWSAPNEIAPNAPNPRGPRMVIEQGNRLHATWFTRSGTATGGERNTIWYSQVQLPAQAIIPAPTLTPIPSPTPTAAPAAVVVPTATPLPAALRDATPIDGPPLWELRGLQAVGLGLLATIGMIGLVAMVRLRPLAAERRDDEPEVIDVPPPRRAGSWQRITAGACMTLAVLVLSYSYVIRPAVSRAVGERVAAELRTQVETQLQEALATELEALLESPDGLLGSLDAPAGGPVAASDDPLARALSELSNGSQPVAVVDGSQPLGGVPGQAGPTGQNQPLVVGSVPGSGDPGSVAAGQTDAPATDLGSVLDGQAPPSTNNPAGSAPPSANNPAGSAPPSANNPAGAAPPPTATAMSAPAPAPTPVPVATALPRAIEQLPEGEIVLDEEAVNRRLANRLAGNQTIQSATMRFVPGEMQVVFVVLGTTNELRAGLAIVNGKVSVQNPVLTGPLGVLIAPGELIGPVEEQINQALEVSGRNLLGVRIEAGRIVVTIQ
jgi:hypothetical protein